MSILIISKYLKHIFLWRFFMYASVKGLELLNFSYCLLKDLSLIGLNYKFLKDKFVYQTSTPSCTSSDEECVLMMLFVAIYLISKLRCISMKSETRKTLTTLNNYTFVSHHHRIKHSISAENSCFSFYAALRKDVWKYTDGKTVARENICDFAML